MVTQCLRFGLWPDIFEESCFCLICNHRETSADVEIMGGSLYAQENVMGYWESLGQLPVDSYVFFFLTRQVRIKLG